MIQHHSFKGILVDFDLMQFISLLQTQNVAYQLWQLMFVSPSGRKRIMVSDAAKLGYSFNNTLYRVYLRAPYHSNESDISTVSCCSQLDTKLYCFHYLPRTSVCLFFFFPASQKVNGVNMNLVTSTSMYRQRWLLMLIDTTVSCPLGKDFFLVHQN